MAEVPRFEGPQFESGPEMKEGDVEFLPASLCETCKAFGIECLFQEWVNDPENSELNIPDSVVRNHFAEKFDCPNLPNS